MSALKNVPKCTNQKKLPYAISFKREAIVMKCDRTIAAFCITNFQIPLNINRNFRIQLSSLIYLIALMPYLVPVEIRDSPIQGKGVFALEDIPEGQVCWAVSCENSIPIKGHIAEENRIYTRE
jgi:SET domain-containing protein